MQNPVYSKKTGDITVTVSPRFLEDESDPEKNHYVWAYRVTIVNEGRGAVQLRRRYWKITDARGTVQEVEGEGVVGEQPVLQPGGQYEYTSGAPLATPGGIMAGKYRMENSGGDAFTVDIPAFSLDSPYQSRSVN